MRIFHCASQKKKLENTDNKIGKLLFRDGIFD